MSTARKETETPVTTPDAFLTAAFHAPCRSLGLPCDMNTLSAELSGADAPAFVWTKIAGPDDPAFAPLTEMGFRAAVEEIVYERPGDAPPSPTAADPGFTVRKITQDTAAREAAIAEELGDLACDNLTTSRFHQDPLVPHAVACEIKKRWAMNFFTGKRGQEMYVACAADGNAVGFNQVLVTPEYKIIDLICTATNYRRRGVARAVVEAMFEPGLKTRVGSQANNAAADAFYKSLGFDPVGTSLCLHWHAGDGA
ncbi:MAG: GNAT family N-acetyltransferase [Rhodospirillales bacterium]